MDSELNIKFITNNAFEPTRGSLKSAGLDLRSAYYYIIPPKDKMLIKTDLEIEVPEGTYGRIAARSGLAINNFIDVGAGVIDEDYRGNVGIVLFNHSNDEFIINKGDKIAQLICEKILYPKVKIVNNLSKTIRSDKGFGSTGI